VISLDLATYGDNMKITTLKKMQDFVGKVCTILTSSVCKPNFTDIQFPDFFLGIVESIDEDGIFAKHPMTGCQSFYNWIHVVGVFQEQVILEDDPQYEELVKEIKKAPPQQQANIVPVDPSKSPFVDPESMAKLAKQAQDFQKIMIQKN